MVQKIQKIALLICLLVGTSNLEAARNAPLHMGNRNLQKPARIDKLPYKASWVSVIKKGKLFKYKRREFSSPRVSGDLIFVGGENGQFYAMKKKNGRKLWRFRTAGALNSTPAIDEERVYFGDEKGILYALDIQRGEKLWEVDLGAEILTAPALGPMGRLYVATVEGKVAAFKRDDGALLWVREKTTKPMTMTIRGNSPPLLDDQGRLYVGFADGIFWCLASQDGTLVWEKSFPKSPGFSDIDGAPLLEADKIYLSTFDGPLFALIRKTGQILWSAEIGSGVAFASDADHLYVAGSRGTVYALEKKSGVKIWEVSVGEGALTAPILHKEVLVVGLSTATMNFIDAKTGRVMFRRFAKKGISSDPILDENRLYYFSNGGRLYSLKMVN